MLRTDKLTLAYDNTEVIRDLSLTVPAGHITCLVGPNGSGKSTLLRGLAGLLAPRHGEIFLEGKPLAHWPRHQLALRVAMLPQKPLVPDGIQVEDLVALGRFPHRRWWQRDARADREVVAEAMHLTGVTNLAKRPMTALSGGQQQRVWISMVLAQQTDVILMDEPTTYLDWGYQLEVLQLLKDLNQSRSLTLILSLHDLNQAARFADHLVVLAEGRLQAIGAPDDVINDELLARVFRVQGMVTRTREGHLLCIGHKRV